MPVAPGIGGWVGQMQRFAGPPRVARWQYFGHTVSSAATITPPAGIIAGDMLAMLDVARATSGTPTAVIPSGWSNNVDSPLSLVRGMTHFKRAAGTEAAAITGMNGTAANAKVYFVFRAYDQYGNVRNPSAFDASSPLVQHVATDPNPVTVLDKLEFDPHVVFLAMGCDTAMPAAPGSITKGGVNAATHQAQSANNFCNLRCGICSGWEFWDTVCDNADYGQNFMAAFYVASSDPANLTRAQLEAKAGKLFLPPREQWASLFPGIDPALLEAAQVEVAA